jgi:hypothetical protein
MVSAFKQVPESDGRNAIEGVRSSVNWFVLTVMLGIAAYLYVNLFVLPRTPLLLGGDQTFFWVDAQRMLYGERPYQDFFQFTPPGADLVYLALFKVFGPRIWVTNAVVLLLGVALCGVCFSIARQIMDRHLALLATLLFLTLTYARFLNATHHWFSVLAIMCGVRVAMWTTSAGTMAAVGALLGSAAFFTQTHGATAVLAFSAFLMWKATRGGDSWRSFLRSQFFLLFGFAIAWLALSGYFIATIGWKSLWYHQVTFVYRYMVHRPEGRFLGLPEVPTWHRLPLVGQYFFIYLLPVMIYPLLLRRCWLAPSDHPFHKSRKVVLLSLVGFSLFIEVTFSLNVLRIYAVSMPAIILLVWLIAKTDGVQRYAVAVVWVGVACMALQLTWAKQHHRYVIARFPAGVAAAGPEAYEKLSWVMGHTEPGQFFFQTIAPSIYLPLALRSPVYVETIWPDQQSRPEYVERTIQQLEAKKVRYLLWSPGLDYPEPDHPSDDHLGPLRLYLHNQYHPAHAFSDQDQILERK